eukprot:TRINITY_DN4193_c0_g1_i2.p1 TRINITY_DN4193_c0_g1~~TRINITY_DN4193_c0_g1_i2.p1  ORF type:complete len:426 (+),score=87.98 TRINITY_DN4193_c0_g1_i2:115-1392(+)
MHLHGSKDCSKREAKERCRKDGKKRWFELNDEKLYYYAMDDHQNKTLKGTIVIADITNVIDKEKAEVLTDPEFQGWMFYLDTHLRRYQLRTMEGEHRMWYWIEGIRTVQAKISARKVQEAREARILSKMRVEEKQHIIDDQTAQLTKMRERFKTAENEWKSYNNTYKRKIHTLEKQLKSKDGQIAELKSRLSRLQESSPSAEAPPSSQSIELKTSATLSSQELDHSSSILVESCAITFDPHELLKDSEDEISYLKQKIKDRDQNLTRLQEELTTTQAQSLDKIAHLNQKLREVQEALHIEIASRESLEKRYESIELQLAELTVSSFHMKGKSWTITPGSLLQLTRWVPDFAVDVCTSCKGNFSVLKRRHHCRACGHVFCGKCTDHWASLPGSDGALRVRFCSGCYSKTFHFGKRSSKRLTQSSTQ